MLESGHNNIKLKLKINTVADPMKSKLFVKEWPNMKSDYKGISIEKTKGFNNVLISNF